MPAGERDAEGNFPEGSINQKVEARLMEFSELRHEYAEAGKSKVEVKIDTDKSASNEGEGDTE